ncbi:MAG: hypothetical protein MJ211_09955 [Bacteroidales bacterium]|nr:hypothetical protein [Bacteroidales bacterium]
MEKKFFLIITLIVVTSITNSFAQNINKTILLRSKEKIEFTETIRKEKPDDNGWIKIEYSDTTITRYQEILLTFEMFYPKDATSILNNQDIQKEIIEYTTTTSKYTDSITKSIIEKLSNEKTLDNLFKKFENIEGYNTFSNDNPKEFKTELNRYPDSKRSAISKKVEIYKSDNILKINLESYTIFFDTSTGKIITPSDLLTNIKYKEEYYNDTLTIVSIKNIFKDEIHFISIEENEKYDKYNHYLFKGYNAKKDNPLLTPYALSIINKDNRYLLSTQITNEYNDTFDVYKFENINNTYKDKTITIPNNLNNSKSTEKIRNRMLEIMFGKSTGDIENLISEGVKNWDVDYEKDCQMIIKTGEKLISFVFENLKKHDNSENYLLVFNKETGEDIKVEDLIKDKKGFNEYVNSFDIYWGGYLLSEKDKEKNNIYNSEFKDIFKHSVNGKFSGLNEFPTSWWYSFTKIGDFIPIEFDTPTMRFYLKYSEIKKYINPKYYDILEFSFSNIIYN